MDKQPHAIPHTSHVTACLLTGGLWLPFYLTILITGFIRGLNHIGNILAENQVMQNKKLKGKCATGQAVIPDTGAEQSTTTNRR